jgi:hypothetical protein
MFSYSDGQDILTQLVNKFDQVYILKRSHNNMMSMYGYALWPVVFPHVFYVRKEILLFNYPMTRISRYSIAQKIKKDVNFFEIEDNSKFYIAGFSISNAFNLDKLMDFTNKHKLPVCATYVKAEVLRLHWKGNPTELNYPGYYVTKIKGRYYLQVQFLNKNEVVEDVGLFSDEIAKMNMFGVSLRTYIWMMGLFGEIPNYDDIMLDVNDPRLDIYGVMLDFSTWKNFFGHTSSWTSPSLFIRGYTITFRKILNERDRESYLRRLHAAELLYDYAKFNDGEVSDNSLLVVKNEGDEDWVGLDPSGHFAGMYKQSAINGSNLLGYYYNIICNAGASAGIKKYIRIVTQHKSTNLEARKSIFYMTTLWHTVDEYALINEEHKLWSRVISGIMYMSFRPFLKIIERLQGVGLSKGGSVWTPFRPSLEIINHFRDKTATIAVKVDPRQ